MANKSLIVIDQGSSFNLTFDITFSVEGANLLAYTCNAYMKKHYGSANSVTFTTNVADSNSVTISLTAAETANIAAGRYVYDVTVTSPSNTVTRIVEGVATVTPAVTP